MERNGKCYTKFSKQYIECKLIWFTRNSTHLSQTPITYIPQGGYGPCMGVTFKLIIQLGIISILISISMYHLPILRTVNLKGRQNGRQFVPVDTKTVSLKLLVLLVMICDWCLWHEQTQSWGAIPTIRLNVTH